MLFKITNYRSFCSILKIVKAFPIMTHLFRPNENTKMTFRRIISILKPNFAEDGSNECLYQNIYNIFVKYLREAGSKYYLVVVVAVAVLLLVDLFEASFPFPYL